MLHKKKQIVTQTTMTTSYLNTDFGSYKGQHMANNTAHPIQNTNHECFT